MVDDISKLYAKILEEQNEKDSKTPIIENHLIEENESQINDSFPKEEPFDNFLLKLGEKIAEHLDISEDVEDNRNEDVDDSENNYAGIPLEKQTTKSSYIEELQKIDKGDKSKLISKNDNISATISEQVKEEIGKVKTQISRMAIEGGGGSVAVQYANGGIMRGDLNVTGKYLSGGIDLSTIIGSGGSSGGGGLSGTTDRLVSGTEVFKLNTDGTFNFPNNIITPQDEIILTLEATKVLDGYYNRLALSPYGFFASDHNGNSITIDSTDNEILIDSNNTYYWKFNNQGALEGPFGTLSVSGNLSATGRVYQNGNDLQSEIESISAISISTKTTVQSNSASWNYQGSDIKALTGNWEEAYTNLVTNSAAYLSSVDLSFLSVSTNWDSAYTTVQNNSASWGASTITTTTSATEFLARVTNADSVDLNRGDVVYTFGAIGDVMSVKKASNTSDLTSARTLGIVNETIIPNGIGYVTLGGSMDKLHLGSYNEGDILWLGTTAGTFTNVRPTQPLHGVYLGVVERANNGSGIAYIKVQNGQELDELHDVLITNVQAGDIIKRNSTNTLWVNVSANPVYQATYYKTTQQNLTNGNTDITFDGDASWNNDNGYITHAANSADFVVVQSGLYQLEFNASVTANGSTWNAANNKVISIDITRPPIAEQAAITQTANCATTQNYAQNVNSSFYLQAGDIINLRVFGLYATATPVVAPLTNTFDLNTWFTWRFIG